ncbi:MAG: adenylate/guanylate cyclase domain-containing protein, partial [Armatimonadota bacterium]
MKAPAPTGVVTILFTDIEGSTALWERLRDRFGRVLSEHDRVLRRILSETEGTEVKHEGDGLMVAFDRPSAAVAFALRAQSALATHEWPDDVGELRVRMGMHTGESVVAADPDGRPEYFGPTVNRAARIAAAGHGGQVLLSATTCDLVRNDLPEGASLVALGQYRLTGLEQPEAVYQLAHPDLPAEAFLPLRTLDRHSHNLPVQLTSFVGREEELQRVVGMLSDPRIRLITLLGPGGVGKTRLALQAAAECAEQFNGGVWLVGLAEVSQPERVPEEIMATLGLAPRSARAPSQEVHDYLSVRELLLILDNFEQVIEAGPFVADLLRATTRVKCLVTSRRGLGIAGERRFHLAPMPVPDADAALQQIARFDSVGLLIERAREHRADWALTHDNAAATAELCARLDGIPLAIELAASRLRAMSVEEVLARLSSRFDLLASRQPDRPPRQRALASAFEWS